MPLPRNGGACPADGNGREIRLRCRMGQETLGVKGTKGSSMPVIGVDCQVVLDGVGYFVEPHAYAMKRARLRKSTVVKGGGERYVDLGPGKREWHMTLLCLNQLTDYSGQTLPATG